jgi:porphobilinogen synthase
MAEYPEVRMRRLRRSEAMLRLLGETPLSVSDLVFPLFVVHGRGIKNEISSMPGIYQQSVDSLPQEVGELVDLGIGAVILFGIPDVKDEGGAQSYHPEGIVQQAVRTIKGANQGLLVITDVCLCGYTSHGHCGVMVDNHVDNDQTLESLARIAVSHAEAGADIVAPSAMMDGQVKTIRQALDESGSTDTAILSYAAKYASGFYGPFREAAESAPQTGDRRSYQMNPMNAREALMEVELDIAEGADMVMVKPALAYLDVIKRVRDAYNCPLAAYNVSGEYSMVKAAVANGWLEEQRVVMEILAAIKRAGADFIISYHAKEAACWLTNKE